jgi:hypothetical protein
MARLTLNPLRWKLGSRRNSQAFLEDTADPTPKMGQDSRPKHSFQWTEQLEKVLSVETRNGLQTAKHLLEDFRGRLNQANKPVPPSIQNVLAEIDKLYTTEPPSDLSDTKIRQRFSNYATMLSDAFDLKAPADNLMKQILSYYHQRTIPQLLDAFGYEELPIEIGKTTAVESLHEIIESRECEYPSGTVAEVLLKGFREKDQSNRVIRKARVVRAQ